MNYAAADAPRPDNVGNWHVDNPQTLIASEPPGPPVANGPWRIACDLVRDYEFSDARIIRAIFRPSEPLLGRNMLLEGRFYGLRLYMGVRVTEVVDETRDGLRVWGWGYETLQGHLEQGKLVYEVVKVLETGEVRLRLRAYSRPAPIPNPIIRVGFRMFGRRTQLRFYRAVGQRLKASVQQLAAGSLAPLPFITPEGLVIAPSGTRPSKTDQATVDTRHPGE